MDPATTLVLPKGGEKFVHVKTLSKSTQDGSLSDPNNHTERRGKLVIPSDVGKLVSVDRNEESDEDRRQSSLQELLDQD